MDVIVVEVLVKIIARLLSGQHIFLTDIDFSVSFLSTRDI